MAWGYFAGPPCSICLACRFFFCAAIASLGYLVWGEYTKKARVSGYLVPDQGLIKLFVKQPGPVIALNVKEGQSVKKGDVLLIISTEQIPKAARKLKLPSSLKFVKRA
jgi:membrane fusion protein